MDDTARALIHDHRGRGPGMHARTHPGASARRRRGRLPLTSGNAPPQTPCISTGLLKHAECRERGGLTRHLASLLLPWNAVLGSAPSRTRHLEDEEVDRNPHFRPPQSENLHTKLSIPKRGVNSSPPGTRGVKVSQPPRSAPHRAAPGIFQRDHENRWAQTPGSVMKQPMETHPNQVWSRATELYVSS